MLEEDRIESRRLSESNDLGSLSRADFEHQPAAGLKVASDCGNETSEEVQAIMSSEKGSDWVMGDFLRQGLFFAFRYVREVSENEMISPHDSLQKIGFNAVDREGMSISVFLCQS